MTLATTLTPPPPRLRERLLAAGPDDLDDAQLLALVLGTGGLGKPVEQFARQLLLTAGGLESLAACGAEQLAQIPGLGTARAASIAAAFALGRRVSGQVTDPRPTVHGTEDALRQVHGLAELRREQVVGLYLDTRLRLVAKELLAVGSINAAHLEPRDVLEPALRALATSFVLIHNHPSGDPEPSIEDRQLTERVRRAAELMGLTLQDHLIVARHGYVSLRARGAF
jgi:DNA repair protein RadC